MTDKAGLREMLQRRIAPLHAAAERSAVRLGVDGSSSHANGHASNGGSMVRQQSSLMQTGGTEACMAVARLQQAAAAVVQLLERGLAHVPDEELRQGAQLFLQVQP